jgi:cyclophilin family peptidyl-prolyl cis-trans isomerase
MKSVSPQRRGGAEEQQVGQMILFPASLRRCVSAVIILCAFAAAADVVRPVSDELRRGAKLAPFYQKHIDIDGFPVLGSSNVSDYAMLESAWVIRRMLTNRGDILRALATNGARLVVMAHNEYTTDIPEQANMTPKVYWDRRARGLGGRIASCAEENMLSFPGDPYSTENILVHEFSHVIHGVALRAIAPTFNRRLREAYQSATNAARWKGTYAATNPGEYWAEGVQSWFDNNRQNDALHNHVDTRPELKEYDPALAALCAEVFGEIPWRYQKPAARTSVGRAHLAAYDASKAPRFQWRKPEVPEKPRVSIETALGVIEVELDAKAAPHTVTNFLRYVQAGLYNDGQFHRTVMASNQPTNGVKIQVIQASGNPAKTNEFFPPIQIERTRDTGLKHLDGTLSMARAEPDSAQDHFFICIGDQPELDFGGKRNPDGQGFAAFGKVVKGVDVVRKIHAAPADGQSLQPPVRIQRALRAN